MTIAGVVTEVTARHEGASFGSDVFLISDGVLPARVQETAEITTTRVEPECYVPPRPGEPARRATGDRPRARAVLRPDGPQAADRHRPGRRPRSTSTSTSSTAPAARTSRSAASPASPPRPATHCSCCTPSSRSGVLGSRAVNAKALVFSVKGEDLLFLDYANIRLDDELRQKYADARAARRALRVRRLLLPTHPRRPDRPAARHRPDQRGRARSGGRCGVLPGRAAALRVHRRRGRTQPVHDGGQPGRRPAAAGRGRAAGKDGARQHRRRHLPHLRTSWSTSSSTGSPTTPPARSGPDRSPGSAPSTPSSGGCGPPSRRCAP